MCVHVNLQKTSECLTQCTHASNTYRYALYTAACNLLETSNETNTRTSNNVNAVHPRSWASSFSDCVRADEHRPSYTRKSPSMLAAIQTTSRTYFNVTAICSSVP